MVFSDISGIPFETTLIINESVYSPPPPRPPAPFTCFLSLSIYLVDTKLFVSSFNLLLQRLKSSVPSQGPHHPLRLCFREYSDLSSLQVDIILFPPPNHKIYQPDRWVLDLDGIRLSHDASYFNINLASITLTTSLQCIGDI